MPAPVISVLWWLQGVQYALDNLHYAQFSAGSAERFWQMLGSSQLEIGRHSIK